MGDIMKLISLELKNYTRLYVSGIKHIIYTPENPFNIILGRNGSGKSSLVKEIFPNVEDLKNDYDKGGYKVLTIKHNDKKYVISYKRDNNSHSFIVDGEELNQQHIQKTQRILIEQHFKLSKPVYELLLSSNNFTSMSVSERKRWFTNILTTIDYEYALNLYNKTKVRIKELTSFMKLIQSKLLKNADIMKEFSPEYVKQLNDDKELFHSMMTKLLDSKYTKKTLAKPNLDRLESNTVLLEDILNKLETVKPIEFYKNEIVKLKLEQDRLKKLNEDVNVKLSKIDSLKIDTGISLKDLEDNLLKENNKVTSLLKKYDVNDIEALIMYIVNFNNNYTRLLSMAEDISAGYSIEKLDLNKTFKHLQILEDKITSINKTLLELDTNYNKQLVFKEQDDVTCPKCSNIFKPNYDDKMFNDTYKKLLSIRSEKDLLVKEYEELNVKYSDYKKHLDNIKQFKDEVTSLCEPFLKLLDLGNIVNSLSNLHIELPDVDDIKLIRDTINDIESKINVYKKLSTEKLNYIAERKDELVRERIVNIDRINAITTTITNHSGIIKKLNDMLEIAKSVSNDVRHIHKYKKDYIEYEYNNYVNNVVFEIKQEITNIETRLIEYDRLKQSNEELEKELKEYEVKLEAVKKLEVLLSPNKGVIGESINSTMNLVLSRMNEIINKVWSYDIDILPCNIEENDLTFRFPVKINNVKDIPDISKGSSSIKDIIDLAFKITAMEFLELLEYPLILDELGSTFSSSHRVSVYEFIDELSKGYFNQIFMISHFEDMFGRFKNTDVIVLDNEGINYTGSYNKIIRINNV
jgi:energy-coupling factor transporter ATP-binding protein EcfA2